MKYAIIAAGEGSRLAAEGIREPKPLVTVRGEHLIDRLMRIFSCNGAEEIVIICNDIRKEVAMHIRNGHYDVPVKLIVKSTPSSMHSFYEISKVLVGEGAAKEPFILTTVDTIFREEEFAAYVRSFGKAVEEGYDGLFAVTDYIDDEKPLYVETDGEMNITAFLDTTDSPKYVSGGIYGLTPGTIGILNDCMARGVHRMRNFQRALIDAGCRVKGYPFTKILDIDHASDIRKAEDFLSGKK